MSLARIVVDANIVFSALKDPHGRTALEFRRTDATFLAPDWLVEEIGRYRAQLARRAGISEHQLIARLDSLLLSIRLVPSSAWGSLCTDPLVAAVVGVDPKDGPYAACFVAAQADFLWTRDKALRGALPGIAVMVLPSSFR